MGPNGSMLQIKSTSTFSRRIGANGPTAIKSNNSEAQNRYRPGLAKTDWLNSRQRLRPATTRHCSFPKPGIGYPRRLWGSNEAKATTGSDALDSMDSIRADGYRDRRLPDRLSNNRRRSGVR